MLLVYAVCLPILTYSRDASNLFYGPSTVVSSAVPFKYLSTLCPSFNVILKLQDVTWCVPGACFLMDFHTIAFCCL